MRKTTWAIGALGLGTLAAAQVDNIGHERHHHRHGEAHPTVAPDETRFITNRDGVELALPSEEESFFFVVYGDRTGGPAGGVSVLADAVRDTNLLEPDLVMTVGDLIQGYNQTEQWMADMQEFKDIMGELVCPWFPVAGNHDIYWRGDGKPEGEHESSYEMHFGPLWYAFEHKNCWFIALYTDESNPETGEKNFNKPECQRMSPKQLAWLKETLARTKGADHVFVFVHHPRWLGGNYGDDWEKVHELLVSAGNVSAVFGGHIHRLRYDPRDGIEYVTLATVGGAQNGRVPEAGWLHHYNIVTVRENQLALSSVPVGEIMDVREITGSLANEAYALAGLRPQAAERLEISRDGSASGTLTSTVRNTSSLPVEATLMLDSADSRWGFWPDHQHQVIEPGDTATFTYHADRMPDSLDSSFRDAEMTLAMDMLASGHRYSIPASTTPLPMELDLLSPAAPAYEMALDIDEGCVQVDSAAIPLPDGPLTLECWFNADSFGDRVGLLAKTENSDYGIFVNKGRPAFSVHIGGSYAEAGPAGPILETGRWYHAAGVFDGDETRLYINGKLVGSIERSGRRRTNNLPLMVGADVNGAGDPTSLFDGQIDEVRLSGAARYTSEFVPKRRLETDNATLLLLNMDGVVGPWLYDASGQKAHPRLGRGAAVVKARE